MMMVQCKLMRDGAFQTAWIDSDAAWPGNMVEVLDGADEFWVVVEAYRVVVVPREVIKENERNFKTHREATDI